LPKIPKPSKRHIYQKESFKQNGRYAEMFTKYNKRQRCRKLQIIDNGIYAKSHKIVMQFRPGPNKAHITYNSHKAITKIPQKNKMTKKLSFRNKPRNRKSRYEEEATEEEERSLKENVLHPKTTKAPKGRRISMWLNNRELALLKRLQERGGYSGISITIKAALSLAERNDRAIDYREDKEATRIFRTGLDIGNIKRKISQMEDLSETL